MASTLRSEDLSFPDRARVVNQQEVVVDASPDRVWQALADASTWPEWFLGVEHARYLTPEPPGVGTVRAVRVNGLDVEEEILAFDAGARFAFGVRKANLPLFAAMVEIITLEPEGERTRLVYRQAFDPRAWLRPVLGSFKKRMHRELGRGLSGLGPWLAR
jgi:uncharacterized protein YndB with AHSA1/START domain